MTPIVYKPRRRFYVRLRDGKLVEWFVWKWMVKYEDQYGKEIAFFERERDAWTWYNYLKEGLQP